MFNRVVQVIFLSLLVSGVILVGGCGDDASTNSDNSGDSTVPVLTTASINTITQNTAQSGGNISSDGGATVTARGVCWSTNVAPTTGDNISTDGSGMGSFTSSLTGLTAGTPYYLRAYATNSVGTGYGEERSFTTESQSAPDSTGTVTDIDGNVYQTIKIGDQWWMMENLKVTHYRNGNPIQHVTDDSTWVRLTTGAYCNYNNDIANVATYGRLYNWFAVDDSRNIAPAGWHVPTDEEWKQLELYLGMTQLQADSTDWRGAGIAAKLKEAGTAHWASPNTGATNESGFRALPGGTRNSTWGNFGNMGNIAIFWSSTEGAIYSEWNQKAWYRRLNFFDPRVNRIEDSRQSGHSVRCVRD